MNFIQQFVNKVLRVKTQKRIPGNLAKRMRIRFYKIPKGYTIARPDTQEYKRIIAASMDPTWSKNPNYGSKGHLKFLRKLIVGSRLNILRSQGARAV